MDRERIMHTSNARTDGTGAKHDADTTPDGYERLKMRLEKLPVTEINDDDYRSFCWPCYALEEPEEGNPGE